MDWEIVGRGAIKPARLLDRMSRTGRGKGKLAEASHTNEAVDQLRRLICGETPASVLRLGASELRCLRRAALVPHFGPGIRYEMRNNAGFYSTSRAELLRLVDLYRSSLESADAVAVWHNLGEAQLLDRYAPASFRPPLRSLDPLPSLEGPAWIDGLNGRHVMVIHPFANSVKAQHHRWAEVWQRTQMPDFELEVVPAEQGIGRAAVARNGWFEDLDRMKRAIDLSPSEVVLVGAGAFGLPLAAHAKARGKIGIQVGGSLQLLFGIDGRRWDEDERLKGLRTPAWIRPSLSETPAAAQGVEGGCYW